MAVTVSETLFSDGGNANFCAICRKFNKSDDLVNALNCVEIGVDVFEGFCSAGVENGFSLLFHVMTSCRVQKNIKRNVIE